MRADGDTSAAQSIRFGRRKTSSARSTSCSLIFPKSDEGIGEPVVVGTRFEALAGSSAEAELYVARCLANTKGCDAAAPRYDSVARRSANTRTGSVAALEAARCYSTHNQPMAARARYQKLKTDNYVSSEANAELDSLDAPRAAKPQATSAPVQVDTQ